jgi:hypothetical protein
VGDQTLIHNFVFFQVIHNKPDFAGHQPHVYKKSQFVVILGICADKLLNGFNTLQKSLFLWAHRGREFIPFIFSVFQSIVETTKQDYENWS